MRRTRNSAAWRPRRVPRRAGLDASLWAVAERLAATRMVIPGCGDRGPETVDRARGALVSRWHRLRRWVEADRDFRGWQERLRVALEQFEASGRDPGTLLRGMPLAEAERWLAERGADIGPAEQAYIRSSRAREGRAVQRLRGLIAGLVILLVVAVTLGINADRQRGRLRQDERLATSQALAAQADATMESRPIVSMLLSVQAFNEADTAEARGSLLRHAVAHTHTNGFLIGHTSRVSGVAYSADGHTVATASVDGTARLWDATTHREVATLAGHTNWLRAVAFSPDGRILATGSDDDTARLWDVGTHREVATLAVHQGAVRAVAFSPDGRTLATASDDGTTRLWDVGSHRQVATLARQSGAVRAVAFSPDGRTLVTAGADGAARLWDVGARRQGAALSRPPERVA